LISNWIIPPPLGRNGTHCIKFPHQMRKMLLNLTSGEPLFLMNKLPCFDDLIEFGGLLAGVLCVGVHDMIKCHSFDARIIEFCRGQLLDHIQSFQERWKIWLE